MVKSIYHMPLAPLKGLAIFVNMRWATIIFLTVMLTGSGCKKGEPPGCDIDHKYYDKSLGCSFVGSAKLDTNNFTWIPYDTSSRLVLVNQSGAIADFGSPSLYDGDQRLPLNKKGKVQGCEEAYCYDSCALQLRAVDFKCNYPQITISMHLKKQVHEASAWNQTMLDNLKDILYIMVKGGGWSGSVGFTIPADITPTLAASPVIFHSQIVINGKTFNDVYEYVNNTQYYPAGFNGAKGIYLSKTMGLVGLYLVNNETWILK